MKPQFAFQLWVLVQVLQGWCATGKIPPPEVMAHIEALSDYFSEQLGDGFFVLPSDWLI